MAEIDQSLVDVNPKQLLQPMTEDYAPAAYYSGNQLVTRNRPPFTRFTVRDMIVDPRIIYGLWLLKGPLIAKGPRRKIVDSKPPTAGPPQQPFGMAFPNKPPKKANPFSPEKGNEEEGDDTEEGDSFLEGMNTPQASSGGEKGEVQGFMVQCDHPGVKKFIEDNLVRFWRTEALKALKAIEWGYSGSEVLYRVKDGYLCFDRLKDLQPEDVSPVAYKGNLVGVNVRMSGKNGTPTCYLGGPKVLWHLHWRERNAWWGMSRLLGAHVPWWEKWCDGGYRDVRRLWYYKNAFNGGTIYHPPGMTKLTNGSTIANKDLAREIIEKMRAGGVLTLPNTPAGDGAGKAWEYDPPTANASPEGLLEYGESLDSETLEALGIPPEVIESSGNQGFGSSTGRQVPQEAFESILQELIQNLIWDFDMQVLRYLIPINFLEGDKVDYEIIPVPISEQGNSQQPGAGGFSGNQFLSEGGEAKDQEEIDAEEVSRKASPKKKSPVKKKAKVTNPSIPM